MSDAPIYTVTSGKNKIHTVLQTTDKAKALKTFQDLRKQTRTAKITVNSVDTEFRDRPLDGWWKQAAA